MAGNTLYYGDNLDILRRYVDNESVDLVYLDPPFNSNADYNVLFAEKTGEKAHSQIKAFEDTWTWDLEAAQEYAEVLRSGHDRVAKALKGMYDILGGSDMLAYLSMMALRLIELHRVLKQSGSIYLHCDPTASHYLKLLMDAVFGPKFFRSEIIWKRSASHGGADNYHDVHDTILYYVRSEKFSWSSPRLPQDKSYIESHYSNTDEGGRYQLVSAHGRGPGPARKFGDRVIEPPPGRHWMSQELIDSQIKAGLIVFTKSGMPRFKRYLDATDGKPISNVWTDIFPINSQAQERLGYPTQKPELLLERIVGASCPEGSTVLDPFCGCGTSIAAAQKLGRKWIGIDITHLAITLIKSRLLDTFGPRVGDTYKTIGEPVDLASAWKLAEDDKYQFQYWALGLVGARPLEEKKGADKGIDGRIYFNDSSEAGEVKEVLISVKGGHVTVNQIRDLRGVIERDGAAIGAFLCIEPPTKPMLKEAADAGMYTSPAGTSHPRIQILTVEQLLGGKKIDMPPWHELRTFKAAPRSKKKQGQPDLF